MEREHVRQELYRIVLKGHLDHAWSEWFEGLTIIRANNGETILTGPVVDQTALHGVLMKIRDVGLPLLALTRIDPGSPGSCTAAVVTKQEDHQE